MREEKANNQQGLRKSPDSTLTGKQPEVVVITGAGMVGFTLGALLKRTLVKRA